MADLPPAFAKLDAPIGRPSIRPEQRLRALLRQALYAVRSELQLMEPLDCNLLFRWFAGLGIDDPVWDLKVLTKSTARHGTASTFRSSFRGILGMLHATLGMRTRSGGRTDSHHSMQHDHQHGPQV